MIPSVWLGIVAFVSGACLMTLEIIAGRLLAPFVGVSIHTWTSVIGVVLAGLSVGAFIGGRVIDHRPSQNKLAGALIAAGITSWIALSVDAVSSSIVGAENGSLDLILLSATLFLPPSVFLGAITPMTARLAIDDVSQSGHTIGWLCALSAAGSILGTFATGFGLVALGSSYHIVLGVGLCLVLLGISTARVRPAGRGLASASVLVLGLWSASNLVNSPCDRETEYHCIRLVPLFEDGESGEALFLDRMVHGYTFPDDAAKLSARSSEIFADLAEHQLWEPSSRLLLLGGGGYVLPRYLAKTHPDVHVDVVEIDPGVTRIARDRLGLEPSSNLEIYHEDGRSFVHRHALGPRYNLLVADVFTDLSLPFHLTTLEFARQVHSVLAAQGVYALHLVDGESQDFLRSVVCTLREAFAHVDVARGEEHGAGTTASYVVIASDTEIAYVPRLRSRLMSPRQLESLLSAGPMQVLTDAYAPIEHLRAGLF